MTTAGVVVGQFDASGVTFHGLVADGANLYLTAPSNNQIWWRSSWGLRPTPSSLCSRRSR